MSAGQKYRKKDGPFHAAFLLFPKEMPKKFKVEKYNLNFKPLCALLASDHTHTCTGKGRGRRSHPRSSPALQGDAPQVRLHKTTEVKPSFAFPPSLPCCLPLPALNLMGLFHQLDQPADPSENYSFIIAAGFRVNSLNSVLSRGQTLGLRKGGGWISPFGRFLCLIHRSRSCSRKWDRLP